MGVLESRDYQAARERLKGNPVIAMMAAGVVTVPLAELAHDDGTPRSRLMNQANRAFDDAEARNAANPAYQAYPKDAHRHIGLIAEAVLAERAAMREAVASAMAPPGTGPESSSLSSRHVEVLATIFAGLPIIVRPVLSSLPCGLAPVVPVPVLAERLLDRRNRPLAVVAPRRVR